MTLPARSPLASRLAAPLAAALLALATVSAQAGTWSFSATLAGGGTLSGWFEGVDGGDGVLSSFEGEITGFELVFSGQAGVGAFTLGLGALTCEADCGLVWTLGQATLGAHQMDGLLADDGAHFVSAGAAVAIDALARVDTFDPGDVALTSLAPIQVSVVPEPGAAALLALGLGALGWRCRKGPGSAP